MKTACNVKSLKHQFLVVGSGRMAKHRAAYLDVLGMRSLTWARATQDKRSLGKSPDTVRQFFLAISDEILESFYEENLVCHVIIPQNGKLPANDTDHNAYPGHDAWLARNAGVHHADAAAR